MTCIICCPFTVLTQEEWNDKQRAERKSEFSWKYDGTSGPKSSSSNYRHFDRASNDEDDDDDDEDMVGPSIDMFFTPANNPNKQTTITSKSFKQPIRNELDDEPVVPTKSKPYNDTHDTDDDLDSIPLPSEPRSGIEIAPPPTYEYYGPNSGRGPKAQDNFVSAEEMQDSISKGFNNVYNKNKPRKIRGMVDDDDGD